MFLYHLFFAYETFHGCIAPVDFIFAGFSGKVAYIAGTIFNQAILMRILKLGAISFILYFFAQQQQGQNFGRHTSQIGACLEVTLLEDITGLHYITFSRLRFEYAFDISDV